MYFPIPEICHYCAGKVILADSRVVQEKYPRKIYLCPNCGAYVGVHKGTKQPMGRLANPALRMKRRETHEVFDAYWKSQGWSRGEAYRWLAGSLHLPEDAAHIGWFEMDTCEQTIQLCRRANKKEAA